MPKIMLPTEIVELNERIKRDPAMTEHLGPVHLLSVPGRSSGRLRATPVSPLDYDGQRWIVAGFAEADWVKNLRAAGWAILTKGKRAERVRVTEVPRAQVGPVLKAFVRAMPYSRFSFAADPEAPVQAFAAIAAQHPTFRITASEPAEPPSQQP